MWVSASIVTSASARDLRRLRSGRVAGLARRDRAPPRRMSPRAPAGRRGGRRSRASRRARCRRRRRPCGPGAAGPITCSGVTPATVSPRCTRPNSGPGVTPSGVGERRGRSAPAARPRTARSRSASTAVAHVDGRDPVAVAADRLARPRVRPPPVRSDAGRTRAARAHQLARARWARGRVSGRSRSRRSKVLSSPGRPSQWSAWKWVTKTSVRSLSPTERQQLALRALAAVEQHPVAAAAHEQRRQAAPRSRHRAGGAGEEDREVHARPSVHGAPAYRSRRAGRPSSATPPAPVAQGIERSPPERKVAGSNPAGRAS